MFSYRENIRRPETLPILLRVSHVAINVRKDAVSTPRGYTLELAHWHQIQGQEPLTHDETKT